GGRYLAALPPDGGRRNAPHRAVHAHRHVRRTAALAAALAALVAPAAASAHPMLVRTDPTAGAVEDTSPPRIALTFADPVEPGFSAISVTNAKGERQTVGAPGRAPGDPRT